MPVYDWRHRTRRPGTPSGLVYDAETGAEIPFMFFWDTETGRVGRYETTADGKLRIVGGRTVEVWEIRKARGSWEEADTPVTLEPCP